jgi:hypothetical protein
MIQVIYGSIFDSKCDLLIIPCGNDGGMKLTTRVGLLNLNISQPNQPIPLGKVNFQKSNNQFANIIGYAASVDSEKQITNSSVISSIAKQILDFSKTNDVICVNLPLLGTGAGKLDPVESYKALKNVFIEENKITFNVFCISTEFFERVKEIHDKTVNKPSITPPRVFVSYSRKSNENEKWVKKLAIKLRENGVDARLDVFHLKGGDNLPQWMTNELIMANKVLLICDQSYMQKADFRSGAGGVAWETMIIQGDMFAQGDKNCKYIAISREETIDQAIPVYMKSKYALSWGVSNDIDDDKFKDLLFCIFDCEIAPPLGEIPPFIKERISQ